MSIQFAGSKSPDDRRRRRLVVNADDPGVDGTVLEEGTAAGISSELVASSAAAPWVPVYEWRVWAYAAMIGLGLTGASVALAMPHAFRPELAPLTEHLLVGERPILSVLVQALFCFLSAQLALLIGWYRAQCKLDFRGNYRVWPWAALSFAVAAVCLQTNAHGLLGRIIEQQGLLTWRADVVSWLLPTSIVALPLVLLLDRDVRRGRSSLYTLRVAWVLAIVQACLELFALELRDYSWHAPARVILPMFIAATIFVGLWLHARVVAYICPDPPEAAQTTARAQLAAIFGSIFGWIAARLVWRRKAAEAEETKPKRTRKKATDEEEDAAPKRKRRAPAKRTTKPRTRVKPAEVEEEVEEEEEYEDPMESSGEEQEQEDEESIDWEAATAPTPPPAPSRNSRDSTPSPQYSASNQKSSNSSWEDSDDSDSDSDDDDDDSDEAQLRRDNGNSNDPLKGLSKRQKRELRRQQRNQRR